jgi:hypothetical protein
VPTDKAIQMVREYTKVTDKMSLHTAPTADLEGEDYRLEHYLAFQE